MTYVARHVLVDVHQPLEVRTAHGLTTVSFSATGTFSFHYPGALSVDAHAPYIVRILVGQPGPGDRPGQRWTRVVESVPLTVELSTPDGLPFTSAQVSMDDLWRFRDLRGTTQGAWSYRVYGQSEPFVVGHAADGEDGLQVDDGYIQIILDETVFSQSAPPLVSATFAGDGGQGYPFDLFRVGTLQADAWGGFPVFAQRSMRLLDPDGTVVASGSGHLSYPVTLRTLDRSRDGSGQARLWTLEVLPGGGPVLFGEGTTVVADVTATERINTAVLQSRIDALLGPHGANVALYGEMQGSDLVARLKFLDEVTAGTVGILGLLDKVLADVPQDAGVTRDIAVGVPYALKRHSRDLPDDCHVTLNDVKVTSIDVSVGPSHHFSPPVPALSVTIGVAGDATVKIGGFPVATVGPGDNPLTVEAGVRLDASGSFSPEVWVTDNLVNVDVSWEAAVAAGVISLGLLTLGAEGLAQVIGDELSSALHDAITGAIESAMVRVPRIFEMVLGAEVTYRDLRLDGNDIVVDYGAPLEPEPKPYRDYIGIIGRSATQLGPSEWMIHPPLGDTWNAPNLARKIDHIVVVMMENRSYDHVLGYRASIPGSGSDGLSPGLRQFLGDQGFPIDPLSGSDLTPNALGLKTRFPVSVGHHLADVATQLAQRLQLPSGGSINSPQGFLDDFHPGGVISPTDVLGFYGATDLPFYAFLADNYAHAERAFASHPGPTLPNRMFALSGDVQRDRTGEPILDNNTADNLALSRAPTIFDLLSRKGVSWRVYESFPSVTMLRMFARYVADDTNIVPLSQFAADIGRGDLPAVTFIDPAMHSYPENDDHPTADMYNGQLFLKGIYDTLVSAPALWSRTALLITYDEHGGFYDHVVPPLAEARSRPIMATDGSPTGPGPITPSTMTTPYGLRVPTFVVSPWAPAGTGPDLVLDHCSILKTILVRFVAGTRPFFTDRVNASHSFDAFLSNPAPRLDVPPSPALVPLPSSGQPRPVPLAGAITTTALSPAMLRRGQVDSHEILGTLARLLGR